MTDIAKRLRARLGFVQLGALPVESILQDYRGAADEIEALRHDVSRQMDIANEQLQEVERLRKALEAIEANEAYDPDSNRHIAKDALAQDPGHPKPLEHPTQNVAANDRYTRHNDGD